ncbi:hypothetical protein [Pleionea sediminis]|uniref:hypothetical protein n=1 Tax=Pleionea sediminis TaxID=2569479 RepID=UPI001186B6B6|nr:hypothetical protein [Pleionea sediminis]
MSDNRYAPPETLELQETKNNNIVRPWSVKLGAVFIILSLFPMLWIIFNDESLTLGEDILIIIYLLFWAVIFTISSILAYFVYRGVRWVAYFVCILTTPLAFINLVSIDSSYAATDYLYIIIDCSIVVLLLLPESRRWYVERKANA